MPYNLINPFKEAVDNSHHRLNLLSASDNKIIGYFCTYTPVELIHASGFIPIRISAGAGQLDRANAHLPDFICPFMKLSLEKALDGWFDYLLGIVQGYSCDAACGMVNIWKDIFRNKFFHSLPIPYNSTSEARAYYKSAIFELIEKLKKPGGHFSQSSLQNSLDLYGEIRNLQIELYHRRYMGNLPVSSSSLMTIMDTGFLTPPDQYLTMLKNFIHTLPKNPAIKENGCPVLITGILIEEPGVLDIIEASGGRIVADDLCNGFRQIFPPHGQGITPMDRLIDRYMNRFPCPSRSRVENRVSRILDLTQTSSARGVIFVLQKFCTPHLADYPALSEELKKNGIPSILIEMDETWQMEAQLKTRLESFFEMLENAS